MLGKRTELKKASDAETNRVISTRPRPIRRQGTKDVKQLDVVRMGSKNLSEADCLEFSRPARTEQLTSVSKLPLIRGPSSSSRPLSRTSSLLVRAAALGIVTGDALLVNDGILVATDSCSSITHYKVCHITGQSAVNFESDHIYCCPKRFAKYMNLRLFQIFDATGAKSKFTAVILEDSPMIEEKYLLNRVSKKILLRTKWPSVSYNQIMDKSSSLYWMGTQGCQYAIWSEKAITIFSYRKRSQASFRVETGIEKLAVLNDLLVTYHKTSGVSVHQFNGDAGTIQLVMTVSELHMGVVRLLWPLSTDWILMADEQRFCKLNLRTKEAKYCKYLWADKWTDWTHVGFQLLDPSRLAVELRHPHDPSRRVVGLTSLID